MTASLAGCSAIFGGDNSVAIEYGDSVAGEITDDSPRDPEYNGLGEPYSFEASDGDAVEISMSSDAFDTYLMLVDGSGDIVAEADDHSLTSTDSTLVTGFEEGGTYTIWATSFEGTTTGEFSLELSQIDADNSAPDPRSISLGQTVEGSIDPFDGRDPEYNDLAEPLSLSLDGPTRVRITMQSEAFDTYVLVTDSEGRVVAEKDDGGEDYNTDMVHEFSASGTYTIWAGSLTGSERGSYTLSATEER